MINWYERILLCFFLLGISGGVSSVGGPTGKLELDLDLCILELDRDLGDSCEGGELVPGITTDDSGGGKGGEPQISGSSSWVDSLVSFPLS